MLLGIPLLAGCSPESAQVNSVESTSARNNHPPAVRSARIVPVPPVLSEPVSVQVEAEDPDRDPLTFRYQWLVNGEPVPGAVGHQLSTDALKRGDRVSVEVIPFDGKGQGAPYRTEPVIVGNTLPVVSRVTIEPGQIRVGDVLQAQVEGTDADHDEVRYRFRWWKNNRLVSEGEENTFDTAGFLRDDVVAVSVIPRDSGGEGQEVFSPTMTIANSPPKITSVPHSIIQQGHYLYTVTAVDPEGDPVSFSLPTAPPGMTIDRKTGRIDWQIPPESRGSYRIKVVVQDDRGGWAFQEFDVSLSAPASS
jgi:translation initiation factor IF-1